MKESERRISFSFSPCKIDTLWAIENMSNHLESRALSYLMQYCPLYILVPFLFVILGRPAVKTFLCECCLPLLMSLWTLWSLSLLMNGGSCHCIVVLADVTVSQYAYTSLGLLMHVASSPITLPLGGGGGRSIIGAAVVLPPG